MDRSTHLERRRLVDGCVDDVRSVVSERALAAKTEVVEITHSVASADDSRRRGLVGETHPGSEVFGVQIDQRAVVERTTRRLDQGIGGGIEIGEKVMLLPVWRYQLIAQTEVQRELIAGLVVVLDVTHVPAAFVVDFGEIVQLVVAARAQQKVGEIVGLPMHGVGGLRGGAAAELSGIGVRAELGMEVRDGDLEISILVAYLDAVAPFQEAIVHLGVGKVWIRELGIRRLAAELRVAGDALRVETTVDAGIVGDVGDVEFLQQVLRAKVDGALAAFGPGETEAKLQNGFRVGGEVVAGSDLPGARVESSVAVAACKAGNVRRQEEGHGTLAVASEPGRPGADECIHAAIALIVDGLIRGRGDVVVASSGDVGIGRRQQAEHLGGEGTLVRERYLSVGIDGSRDRVHQRG